MSCCWLWYLVFSDILIDGCSCVAKTTHSWVALDKPILELYWRHSLRQTQRSNRLHASSHLVRSYHLDFQSMSQISPPLLWKRSPHSFLGNFQLLLFCMSPWQLRNRLRKGLYCYKAVIFLSRFTMFKSTARLRQTSNFLAEDCHPISLHNLFPLQHSPKQGGLHFFFSLNWRDGAFIWPQRTNELNPTYESRQHTISPGTRLMVLHDSWIPQLQAEETQDECTHPSQAASRGGQSLPGDSLYQVRMKSVKELRNC